MVDISKYDNADVHHQDATLKFTQNIPCAGKRTSVLVLQVFRDALQYHESGSRSTEADYN